MCDDNANGRTGWLAGCDFGVSEVLGTAILLGIVVTGVSLLLLSGTQIIDQAKGSATLNNVEQAFTMADSRLSKARFSTAIFQEAPFEISQGVVTIDGAWNNSHIIIYEHDNITGITTVLYNKTLGTIKCITDQGEVAYQDGGVWMRDGSGGSVMLSPPDFDYNGVTLTLPVMNINGNVTMAATSSKVRINADSTDPVLIYPGALGGNPIAGNRMINITIKSDYYQAWADYINERTRATAVCDSGSKTVFVSLNTGKGLQSGLANAGYTTVSMDTNYDAPVLTFDIDLFTRNRGNDYTATYGVKPPDGSSPDPDFQITITRTTGSGNKDTAYIKTYFRQGGQVEAFETYQEFHRKSDTNIDFDLLNNSIVLDYTSDSAPQSVTWGDDPSTFDSCAVPLEGGYNDSSGRDVAYGDQKTLFDIIQHYMSYMAKYDQAHGNQYGGPKYGIEGHYKFDDQNSMFYLEYASSEDIKYLYVTEGTLNTALAGGA